MGERNVEGTEAKPRFRFGKGYKPAFPEEVGYGSYVGARAGDRAPFRSFTALVAVAVLSAVVLVGVVLVVVLH